MISITLAAINLLIRPALLNPSHEERQGPEISESVEASSSRIERDERHLIYIKPQVGNDSSAKNATINFELSHWNKRRKKGIVFDSPVGFIFQIHQ